MGEIAIAGALLTPLRIIDSPMGAVLHAVKHDEAGFAGFGEAYFSRIKRGAIKGWKKHREMTLNIVVPVGEIEFVLFDDRTGSPSHGTIATCVLSPQNYQRLTVPPGVWMAFRGRSDENLLLNVASHKHDLAEAETVPIENGPVVYDWS